MIFKGDQFAEEKTKVLEKKVIELKAKGITPKLASILIGNNPQSQLYLALKGKRAKELGIDFKLICFKNNEDSDLIKEKIKQLNSDPSVQGIMVQLPLPERYQDNKEEILSTIDPGKDVDCLTPTNLDFLLMGDPRIIPATPKAVMQILAFALKKNLEEKKWLAGEDICVVGASNLVGKPMAMMLSNLGATVTICRSTTPAESLAEAAKKAKILVSAVGKPGLITKEMVKPGAVVIDVGITNLAQPFGKTKILGDVDREVAQVASFYTPVPGGVGPVTVICLMENLLEGIRF